MLTVAAFYRFTRLVPEVCRTPLLAALEAAGARGTVLLAPEGVNGTLALPPEAVPAARAALRALPGCADLDWTESRVDTPPFRRLKVRTKPEIVTMGAPDLDPARTGTYVPPEEWNALIARDDVAVIDTRNAYEVRIGRFDGAIDPGTDRFRDFPAWWASRPDLDGRPIAMYCTGGIRCEKASAFLLEAGVRDVFHLEGGILKYLETVPASESRWRGGCFVFDDRVSVGHDLTPDGHILCHGCRRPLTTAETHGSDYEPGVSCFQCKDQISGDRQAGFRERQRQVNLAQARGISHLA
ncbi:MAG: rhodanese-related sulfurtransferase [Pseudomonadota bacterium]